MCVCDCFCRPLSAPRERQEPANNSMPSSGYKVTLMKKREKTRRRRCWDTPSSTSSISERVKPLADVRDGRHTSSFDGNCDMYDVASDLRDNRTCFCRIVPTSRDKTAVEEWSLTSPLSSSPSDGNDDASNVKCTSSFSRWSTSATTAYSNSWLFASIPSWIYLFLLLTSFLTFAESCSSRTTPKPQQPPATMRPNMTFQTNACPPMYAAWYCLNGATCFTVKIGESILYNCECADGYMGQRCEYKDLDQSYLASRGQVMVETASIAGGVTVAVLLIVILSISVSVYCRRRAKIKPLLLSGIRDKNMELKPFRTRPSFSSSIRMSTTMYSVSNEPPEPAHKVVTNSKVDEPNTTSA